MAYAERGEAPEHIPPIQSALHTPSAPEQSEAQEQLAASRMVFHLPEIIAELQAVVDAPTHEERTRVLIDTPDHSMIVSGYQPGEGEDLHAHPTHNTLLFITGVFDLYVVNKNGEEEHHETYPGMMVALDRGQPHRVRARADQEGLSIVMVSIIEGMPTSAPGYSVPVRRI